MNYVSLGASLYVPATRHDLVPIGNGESLPRLRSVIFCTEDSVLPEDVELAVSNLEAMLPKLQPATRLRFIRPRNLPVLRRLLTNPAIDAIDGFVLPKVTVRSLESALEALEDHPHLHIMPTLETENAFDLDALRHLRTILSADNVRARVASIRIGGNDLLQLLGIRRSPLRTIYETVMREVIAQIVMVFKPAGFNLTAPVFEGLNHPDVLAEEVDRDLDHGLFGKTAIHPDQIHTIEERYAVTPADLEMADRALAEDAPAVFRMHDTMVEPATHAVWARFIHARAAIYGVR